MHSAVMKCLITGSFILCVCIISSTNGDCVFRGHCGTSEWNFDIPCVANSNEKYPQILPNASYTDLLTICPDFSEGNEGFCCDQSQVRALVTQAKLIGALLARCPSCYFNMLRIFCHLTCSPHQSRFINVTASRNSTIIPGQQMVSEIDYFLREGYINRAYESCAEVRITTNLAIVLLCGVYGSECSPKNLLTVLGTSPPSPIAIHFEFDEPTGQFQLFDYNTTKCSERPPGGKSACSCTDCSDSCKPFSVPDDPPPLCFFGVDGYYVLGGCLFLLMIGGGFSALIFRRAQFGARETSEDRYELFSNADEHQLFSRIVLTRLGFACASRPWTVILIGLTICGALCSGIVHYQVIDDPVELWSGPESVARLQRNYYNEHFGPFYRVEQVIVVNKRGEPFNYTSNITKETYEFGPVFRSDFLLEVFNLQEQILNLTAFIDNGTTSTQPVRLEDICFSPLNAECAIQSLPNWFQNNMSNVEKHPDNYLDHIIDCIRNPTLVPQQDTVLGLGCLGTYGGPSFSYVALGGYEDNRPETARALIITLLVNNHVEPEKNDKAVAWENAFVYFMKNYRSNMSVAFLSENSIVTELHSETLTDLPTIAISYMLMFLYVAIALGRYRSLGSVLTGSQIVLAAVGVLLVLLSIASAIGTLSYFGVATTLIVFEVVPFLVLAIGVDNIFILVQRYQRTPRLDGETLEQHVARSLGSVGPSMVMACASELFCFCLGITVTIPAVRTFALCATLSLFIDFVLQTTVFVACMTLDLRRQEANRLDVFCCLRSGDRSDDAFHHSDDSALKKFMKNVYTPLLAKSGYRKVILVTFLAIFCLSASLVHKIDVGLDQEVSMPSDSYLQDYFLYLRQYLQVGPPVFFVVGDGYNYSEPANQDLIRSTLDKDRESLVNIIQSASMRRSSEKTLIASPAMSWIDDFSSWTRSCCMENDVTHVICPPNNITAGCTSCQLDNKGRVPNITTHIRDFLNELPSKTCPVGGHAAYSNAVELKTDASGDTVEIGATSFMTYHTALRTSSNYTKALKMSRYLANRIEATVKASYKGKSSDVKIFPYSIFYVFYEQYLTMWTDVAVNVALSLAGILLISLIFMNCNTMLSLALIFTIIMAVVDLMGVMYIANIPLNSISMVNLVAGVGITVEFCSHIVKAYSELPDKNSIGKISSAVCNIGSSVLSGITCTKLLGVMVLAFARSQLFVIFYFRMYIAIVLIGSIHALVFLPVFVLFLEAILKPV